MTKYKSVVIIGYGSIGRLHAKILKKLNFFKKIYVLTKQKNLPYESISSLNKLIVINPDYFVICSETYKHFDQLKFINDNFNNKTILIEKPIFEKYYNLKLKSNKIFVAYNFRFHPIINFLKKFCENKESWTAQAFCGSYLPNWRKNISYQKSYSSSKKRGGGVLLDLSHEFDYLSWIFGKLKSKFFIYKKISNLSINSKDYLSFTGISSKSTIVQINLNYFSKISKRFITVEGKNFSIFADLIKNTVDLREGKKKKIIRFSRSGLKTSYIIEHQKILSGQIKNVCKYAEAIVLAKLFNKIN